MTRAYALAVGCALTVLGAAAAADVSTRVSPADTLIGNVATVAASSEETLLDIGRRHALGYHDMVRANPEVDPWLPPDGAEVVLPLRFVLPDAPARGIVLNLAEYRLYFFPDDERVVTYPISIGRMDWETPLGKTRIVAKARNPTWYPPDSVREEHAAEGRPLPRVVPPGPDNPLGTRALRLALPGYLIHGTNRPAGVGMRVTHGCLRMYPENIEVLFEQVAVQTPVRIVNQPVKAGWSGDRLYLEVHPALESAIEDEEGNVDVESDVVSSLSLTEMTRAIVRATRERRADIDWSLAEQVFKRADGVPVEIGIVANESGEADSGPGLPGH